MIGSTEDSGFALADDGLGLLGQGSLSLEQGLLLH